MLKTAVSAFTCFAFCFLNSAVTAQEVDLPKTMLGNWNCNSEKTIVIMKEAGATEDRLEMAKQVLGGMKMEFTKGNLKVALMGQEIKATYRVEEYNPAKKWVKLSIEAPQRPDIQSFEFTLDEADSFTVKLRDQSMIFDRAKKTKTGS